MRTPGQLADVTEQANQGLVQATELLKDIRAGKGTLGKLVTDEALYNEVTKFVDAANAVATNLRNGRGTLGKLANDDAGLRAARGLAQEPPGDDDAHQQGRGEPRPALERRRVWQFADEHDEEPGWHHRTSQSW